MSSDVIKFYSTAPHECSYLEGEQATTLFVDPDKQIDIPLYTALSEHGFRRSGKHLYKPNCEHCDACIPVRIPVAGFNWKRRFKRIMKRNEDIDVVVVNDISGSEYYQLYARYIRDRHRDGDMYPPSQEQYQNFLTSEWKSTEFLRYEVDGKLLGVAVTDNLVTGLSAIYTFFDPRLEQRSLGVYSVLKQIELCKERGLDYLYLGYWIKNCAKMAYKSEYRPMEILSNAHWLRVN